MRYLLTLSAALMLAACSDDMLTAPAGEEFTIAVGDVTEIAGTPLVLKFVRVPSDSRCPMGALCVQSIGAGNAQVELQAALAGARVTITLNTTDGPSEAFVGSYVIRLAGLTPFRQLSSEIDPKAYRADLVVTPGGQ